MRSFWHITKFLLQIPIEIDEFQYPDAQQTVSQSARRTLISSSSAKTNFQTIPSLENRYLQVSGSACVLSFEMQL